MDFAKATSGVAVGLARAHEYTFFPVSTPLDQLEAAFFRKLPKASTGSIFTNIPDSRYAVYRNEDVLTRN